MAAKVSVKSKNGSVRRAIVVGGGLGGLMTVIKLCEAGIPVDIISLVPVKRSHSVCAQGGINASVNLKGEGDSPAIHMEETILGGDFLANQPPVKGMAEAAPGIVYMLDRMGVPFNRTPEGNLDFRRFGGTLFHRTAFSGATTGQQLMYALDEQVRRYETLDVQDERGVTIPGEKMVRKFEFFDLADLIMDDNGVVRGVIAQDLKTSKMHVFRGDAVCLATGGAGMVFGRSTNSVINTGSASAVAYRRGAMFANAEFIQVHPTAIPGPDKLRLISESVRGEGGRVWVPRDRKDKRAGRDIPEKERYYFLEERYPAYKNLVPRDIASREIFRTVVHEGYQCLPGVRSVYLDVSHLASTESSKHALKNKLGGVLEIYEKFAGEDPYTNPMQIFPAVHYSMGGLWVDFETDSHNSLKIGASRNASTNLPGLFATGEADYQYHGANRLGANSLLSCIYGGMVTGPSMATWREETNGSAFDLSSDLFDKAEKRATEEYTALLARTGSEYSENAFKIHDELAEDMLLKCTVERKNDELTGLVQKIDELKVRLKKAAVLDTTPTGKMNQPAVFLRHMRGMLDLAEVIAKGALARDENRGAHYKPVFDSDRDEAKDHPEGGKGRDDKNWLKTTRATFTEDGAKFDYEPVDISLVVPRARVYKQKSMAAAVGSIGATTETTEKKDDAHAPA
ncbi:MAG: succinate dehydrogenase flavoprotein subunit [Deltaproteobacteria bacterium]|nr:succinate dehydrogenase flavoprotein subunit [Deltaproteobacteria bacterium]